MSSDLGKLNMEIQAKWGDSSLVDAGKMPTSLNVASDGMCQFITKERATVAKKLREAGGPTDVPILETNRLVQMVGSAVSPSEPINPYLVAARSKLSPPPVRDGYRGYHYSSLPLLEWRRETGEASPTSPMWWSRTV